MSAKLRSRPSAAPRERALPAITCRSSWKEAWGSSSISQAGYPGGGEIDLGIERGELTISTYFAREPFLTWHKKRFVRPIMQTPKKRDARVADVPSIYELMGQYKTPEATPACGHRPAGPRGLWQADGGDAGCAGR
jgi:hypothetical protein